MDINTLRIMVTVVSFITFVGILIWAYSRGARKGFDEAAMLPFLDDEAPRNAGQALRNAGQEMRNAGQEARK